MFLVSQLSSLICLTFLRDLDRCLRNHFKGTKALFSKCFQVFVMPFGYRNTVPEKIVEIGVYKAFDYNFSFVES